MLTAARTTRAFRTGYRFGGGPALAVVRPGDLVEQWRVFQACVEAGVIVIVQAANTGLTGGSTPDGDAYDRSVVIINTRRIGAIHLIRDGRQAICLAGATLDTLEGRLKPLGREPHSVIGSSCIGASVVGGICNNSGGALIRRGPAFSQLAIYGRVDADGSVRLVNHLGVDLGDHPEVALARLQAGDFAESEITEPAGRLASDRDYEQRVRDIEASTPARYNADPDRLFEASGSAGKVMVLAVRVDTYPRPERTGVFYVGTNDPDVLTGLRRDMLAGFAELPVAAEYMHRDCYDVAREYGKDSFLAIRALGAGRIPLLFDLKAKIDSWVSAIPGAPRFAVDRLLQWMGTLARPHLPARMETFRDRFEHHLILRMADGGVEEARAYLARLAGADFFECEADEAEAAFLHRFVAAGAAVRYRAVRSDLVSDIVSLDIALPRNATDWSERLPEDLAATMIRRLYYGHFFCHVLHQDYVIARAHDPHAIEERLLALLDQRGAVYPAEHNVGHLYDAGPAQVSHFQSLDPCNCMNPGVGRQSRDRFWGVDDIRSQ